MTYRVPIATMLMSIALATSASANVRTFFSPAVEGVRISTCLGAAESCGKPAADAFCKVEGFEKSVLFERQPAAFTRNIETGAMCEGTACQAFKQIKCFTVKDDLAALP